MVYVLVGHAGVATVKKYIKSSISTGSQIQIVQLFLWARLLSFHWTLSLLNNFHFLSVSELILYKRHGLYSFIKSIEDLLSIFKWHIQPKILPGFYYQMNICLGNNIDLLLNQSWGIYFSDDGHFKIFKSLIAEEIIQSRKARWYCWETSLK